MAMAAHSPRLQWEECAFVPQEESVEVERLMQDLREPRSDVSVWLEAVQKIEEGAPAAQYAVTYLVKAMLLALGFTHGPAQLKSNFVQEDALECPLPVIGGLPPHQDLHLFVYAATNGWPVVWMLVHPDRKFRREYAEMRLVTKAVEAMDPAASVILGLLVLDTAPVFYRISRRVGKGFKFRSGFNVEVFDPKCHLEKASDQRKIARYLLGFKRLLHQIAEEYDKCPQRGGMTEEELINASVSGLALQPGVLQTSTVCVV